MSIATEIGLCLGTNLGDRLANLRQARAAVSALDGVIVTACSKVYETDPVGVRPEHEDKPFLNAVVVVDCRLDPGRLLRELQGIEADMGRVRGPDRCAPRPIDMDILYVSGGRIETGELTAPHPRWASRRFVVQPLADVRPGLVLPGETRTVAQILLSLPHGPDVVLFAEEW